LSIAAPEIGIQMWRLPKREMLKGMMKEIFKSQSFAEGD
jgi:hypothetical protein